MFAVFYSPLVAFLATVCLSCISFLQYCLSKDDGRVLNAKSGLFVVFGSLNCSR